MLHNIRFKNIIIGLNVIIISLFVLGSIAIAGPVGIKGIMKIHRMGGYVIVINYETFDKWVDGLLFKVHCKFDGQEFIFASSALDDIEYGWHKTEIVISETVRKRYGSLKEYTVELYHKGILIDTKKDY